MGNLQAFTMPKWGIEMVEGTLANWVIGEGDAFDKGDTLALIETDKITNEVEAEYAGTLARIIAGPGETHIVGALLAVFDRGNAEASEIDAFIADFIRSRGGQANGTSPSTPNAAASLDPAPPAVQTPAIAASPAALVHAARNGVDLAALQGSGRAGRVTYQDVDQAQRPAPPAARGEPVSIAVTTGGLDHVFASPLAKRIALHHGIDLTSIPGSGPRGRIGKADVLRHVRAATPPPASMPAPAPEPAPAPGVDVRPMSAMRKAIARQLLLSKTTIPHFYLRLTIQVDALIAFRQQAKRVTGEAPSINDYAIRATAIALGRHPGINIQVHGDRIHRFPHADIAVAVATDKGLVTPIMNAAETKSVARISAEMKQLADRARKGQLRADEIQGGSFTISNLGAFGIEAFDAIINPPQGAIMAIGAMRRTPIDAGHALAFATQMQVSLSCDHRAIDGADGAQFLATVKQLLENPDALTD